MFERDPKVDQISFFIHEMKLLIFSQLEAAIYIRIL